MIMILTGTRVNPPLNPMALFDLTTPDHHHILFRPRPSPYLQAGGGGGGVLSLGKGYQLRSDLSGAVAVASQDGYKKGGCPVIISSQRRAVIVLIVDILDQTAIVFFSDYS